MKNYRILANPSTLKDYYIVEYGEERGEKLIKKAMAQPNHLKIMEFPFFTLKLKREYLSMIDRIRETVCFKRGSEGNRESPIIEFRD
jgi:hypothetical protein